MKKIIKGIIFVMAGFHYYYPVTIRYSDLDAQGHVNNATYLTYFEEARVGYVKRLGLWNGESFLDVGIIVAEAQVSYKAPIRYGVPLQVGVRVQEIGNKSLKMEYSIEQETDGAVLATGSTVLVAFDYRAGKSMSVPANWRKIISEFESKPELP